MKKILLAGVTGLVLAGSTAVYAQPWSWSHHGQSRMSMEDRTAFADAKIAAVKAGLKLTADQDKLWPPVEAAVRDMVKLRIDRANARMQARQDADRDAKPVDPVAKLRDRADTMAATAAAMKKIADAADPLYKTLDDGQKRRLAVLTRHGRPLRPRPWPSWRLLRPRRRPRLRMASWPQRRLRADGAARRRRGTAVSH